MIYVIQHEGEFFVDFSEGGQPIWCKAIDALRRFVNREEAIKVRNKLRSIYRPGPRVIDLLEDEK